MVVSLDCGTSGLPYFISHSVDSTFVIVQAALFGAHTALGVLTEATHAVTKTVVPCHASTPRLTAFRPLSKDCISIFASPDCRCSVVVRRAALLRCGGCGIRVDVASKMLGLIAKE